MDLKLASAMPTPPASKHHKPSSLKARAFENKTLYIEFFLRPRSKLLPNSPKAKYPRGDEVEVLVDAPGWMVAHVASEQGRTCMIL